MYPSISICKKYSFEALVYNKTQQNIDINQLVQSVQSNTWGLDQQFYFFTHPGAMNRTFPCTTTLGGTTSGRPCVFPVTYSWNTSVAYFLVMAASVPQ